MLARKHILYILRKEYALAHPALGEIEAAMQFKENTPIFDREGGDVGKVDCVVVDPQSKDVTHLIVCEGRLLNEDKVIPLHLISLGSSQNVLLKCHTDELHTLLAYNESHYLAWDHPDSLTYYPKGYAPPYFWYPPAGAAWWNDPGYHTFVRTPEPMFTEAYTQPVPWDCAIPLSIGMDVLGAESYRAGHVQHLYTVAESGRVTHIVIGQSPLFSDYKLVPSFWIDTVSQGAVILLMDVITISDLPGHTM